MNDSEFDVSMVDLDESVRWVWESWNGHHRHQPRSPF